MRVLGFNVSGGGIVHCQGRGREPEHGRRGGNHRGRAHQGQGVGLPAHGSQGASAWDSSQPQGEGLYLKSSFNSALFLPGT